MSSTHRFRIRFSIGGGHVHCRMFIAPDRSDPTFAKMGDLVVSRGSEFVAFMLNFKNVEFRGDTDADTIEAAGAE